MLDYGSRISPPFIGKRLNQGYPADSSASKAKSDPAKNHVDKLSAAQSKLKQKQAIKSFISELQANTMD
ncbi:MAG: hypothetical protein HUJ51_05745 [Eggerthellaceae bacterium]|nr:hypothetical protein [Eggerthellaceae bacterium]